MHERDNYLYKTNIMDYFADHLFGPCHSAPRHCGESHHVPIYHGIQYNHAGNFFLRIDGGERLVASGPHVFISHPGAFFEYGNLPGESRHHAFLCSFGGRLRRYCSGG